MLTAADFPLRNIGPLIYARSQSSPVLTAATPEIADQIARVLNTKASDERARPRHAGLAGDPMSEDQCDARPRVHITPNRDGRTFTWSRHPAAKGRFAGSPGQALDAALAEIGGGPAVIIWEGRA